jgi:1-deoxy-D-xylulose-5-phosphate reductoisomerase
MKNVAILGSTGTIGCNTLDVVRRNPGHFRVSALAAGSRLDKLAEQIREFRPRLVSIAEREQAAALDREFRQSGVRTVSGPEGAVEVAAFAKNDIVVSGITGINGLRPTLAAVQAGKRVALANKESMVVAGELLQAEAQKSGVTIVPVDSEHSGVFQCLAKEDGRDVKKVTLTASGGPFFRVPLEKIRTKTVEEALAHPRWKMGKKVTVDSATLMNKGLELIEARWLFGLKPESLDILIHPQSIVHALVETRDGSILAQLSPTDMRIPIQFALSYPERLDTVLPSLDLASVRELEFYPVEIERYPLIRLAYWALGEGESAAVALNGANEVAVEAFLGRRIGFCSIYDVVAHAVEGHRTTKLRNLEEILEADRRIRERAQRIIQQRF